MGNDKRSHPRFPTMLETIYFCEDDATGSDRMYFPGKVIDKSRGGVGMLVSFPHKCEHKLFLEGLGEEPNPLECTVRWISKAQSDDQYRMGVQFAEAAD